MKINNPSRLAILNEMSIATKQAFKNETSRTVERATNKETRMKTYWLIFSRAIRKAENATSETIKNAINNLED